MITDPNAPYQKQLFLIASAFSLRSGPCERELVGGLAVAALDSSGHFRRDASVLEIVSTRARRCVIFAVVGGRLHNRREKSLLRLKQTGNGWAQSSTLM
jgi:hypothetical protein